jgi:hypothetical protein
MNTKRFAGLAIAGLFYGQAVLGLVAIGVVAQKPRNLQSIDAGYGLTLVQAAELVQRY